MCQPWKPFLIPVLTAVMFLLSCGRSSFVLVKLTTGSAPLTGVVKLEFELQLGDKTDRATFSPGKEISFPASATLEIGSGIGALTGQVVAKNGAEEAVGYGSSAVTVAANADGELNIQLNPTLASLSFSTGTLNPAFAPDKFAYTLSVSPLVSSVQVTPFFTNPTATLLINSSVVATGVASPSIALGYGVTMISIAVKVAGSADRVYAVAVNRSSSTYLKASNTDSGDNFGATLSISGDTLAVGAPGEDSSATGVNGSQVGNSAQNSGAVYVFVRSGSTWIQQAYLKSSNSEASDSFGASVSLSGDTLAVGAFGEDSSAKGVNSNQFDNGAPFSGAVYVFVRSGSNWTQQAYLKASNTEADDFFGAQVSLSGDTLAVAAMNEDSIATGINGNQADNSNKDSGAVYVFVRTGSTWTQQAYLKASNAQLFDLFGYSVSLSGDTLAVGAREDSSATGVNGNQADNSAQDSGAVYVFVRTGSTWTQQAYLKASNAQSFDLFGDSVSLSGDTLAVGACSEDSSATGVNGSQVDNSAYDSGAVYVFVRSGSSWTQQAYLKASNAQAGDSFGLSVALSGDILAIAAYREDSNATGIDGNQADNSAGDSGAAYVFVRSGSSWAQRSYLKASNSQAGYLFGISVSLSGNTLAVGARDEDSAATGVDRPPFTLQRGAPGSGAAYIFY